MAQVKEIEKRAGRLAADFREQMGEDLKSPIDIFALAATIKNLTLVRYPLGELISGICIKQEGADVIAINSGMTLGRQRFSLAHEIYHLLHDEKIKTALCDKVIGSGHDESERCADAFASHCLMPEITMLRLIDKETVHGSLSLDSVVRMEQYFQVSRGAMLYRLKLMGAIEEKDAAGMRKNVKWSAVQRGYSDDLYRPTSVSDRYGAFGNYIHQARTIRERELVSQGKYEELLLDGFRSDIVYGSDCEGGDIDD